MRTAFVYYLEFTEDDNANLYLQFLKKSINGLLQYKMAEGPDIFINVIGNDKNIHDELIIFCAERNINVIDISEDRLHYLYLPKLVDIPIPEINCLKEFPTERTYPVKFFNHKFTSYPDIIAKGYDRIVQLDADVLFYDNVSEMFEEFDVTNPDLLYYCRFPVASNIWQKDFIRNNLISREWNHTKLFSLINTPETFVKYTYTKKIFDLIFDYNIDNLVDDIYNQGFWVSGGTGIFSKAFVQKHFKRLSFINYFVTKDDELALMLYCLANKIVPEHLDKKGTINLEWQFFDKEKYKIFHPGGIDLKKELFINNWTDI